MNVWKVNIKLVGYSEGLWWTTVYAVRTDWWRIVIDLSMYSIIHSFVRTIRRLFNMYYYVRMSICYSLMPLSPANNESIYRGLLSVVVGLSAMVELMIPYITHWSTVHRSDMREVPDFSGHSKCI